MKWLKIATAASMLLMGIAGLVGCIYLPGDYKTTDGKPRPESQIGPAGGDKPLQIARATRQDVLRVLGVPAFDAKDGESMTYTYQVNTGVLISLCYGVQTTEEGRYLRIHFSPDGRLKDFKVFKNEP